MAITIDEIKTTHPNWHSLNRQYDYLYRSYLGGPEYRDGAYLRKYLNEDAGPGNQYVMRLLNTPLYNYCKTTVDVYRSFLFRIPPTRKLGDYMEDIVVKNFIKDADHDGRNLTAFMKMVADKTTIFGNMWIMVDRPAYQAQSRAEELVMDIRPYVTAYHPGAVLEWRYESQLNGRQQLSYIKVVEESYAEYDIIKIWTMDSVTKVKVEKRTIPVVTEQQGFDTSISRAQYDPYVKIISQEEFANPLGYIPFVSVVGEPGMVKGTGVSLLADVADLQRSIYNKLSSLEQTIRISGHPTLVKSVDTEASAGAGAIITMPDNLPDGLRPFLLQPSGASIDGIIKSIDADVAAINDITHLQAVRATVGSPMSGVALQTEFAQLNSRLSDIADMLEEAETKIWKLFFDWEDLIMPDDFEILYEKSFDLRDKHSDLELYRKGLEILNGRNLPVTENNVLKQVAGIILLEDDDIQESQEEIDKIEDAAEVALGLDDEDLRTYPDGEAIPAALPPAYQPASNTEVPAGQNCANCAAYNPDTMKCSVWANAVVRPNYWCAKWVPVTTE